MPFIQETHYLKERAKYINRVSISLSGLANGDILRDKQLSVGPLRPCHTDTAIV